MSILASSKRLLAFMLQYDLCEYGTFHLITMPDGQQFVTESVSLANRMLKDYGAQTRHIVEIGE
jgi:hypothetical protein